MRGACARPLPRGGPGKRPRTLSWLWWVLAILCSLGVGSGVCFVVSLVRVVHGAMFVFIGRLSVGTKLLG